MVVVFIVAIRAQAILFIIAWMSWDSFIGMDLFDMRRWVLIHDGRRGIVAGAILVYGHAGQREQQATKSGLQSIRWPQLSAGENGRDCVVSGLLASRWREKGGGRGEVEGLEMEMEM